MANDVVNGIEYEAVKIAIGSDNKFENFVGTENPLPVKTFNGQTSRFNNTNDALNNGQSFIGTFEDCSQYACITLACYTDKSGILYIDFSVDGVNVDSTLTFNVAATTNEVHRVTVTRKFFRLRFYNNSGENQTYLRVQSMLGSYPNLSSPFNLTAQQDADATLVKSISDELLISSGLISGYTVVQKFGRNGDIDTASVPEDIWNGGGVYAGFPTGSPEEFEVFSSSASDTGVLMFTYLPTTTSTEYLTHTVTLQGTTPVSTGITGYRMHTANYASGSSTTFNVGTITIRHKVTTANIFCVMPIGRSQTNVASYTVPFGHTAKIVRLFARVIGSTSGTVDGALWVRSNGGSPRLRRPFTCGNSAPFEEMPYGGISISAQSDIQVRISAASANNLDVISGYDIILIKN